MVSHHPSRRLFLRGSASLALLLAARGSAGAQERKVLRLRTYSDINSIDPAFVMTTETDGNITMAIYSRLVTYEPGERWTWRLDAAESIEQVDATHVRFKLRPGIKWTNGFGEMTAEDVKFSFERIADPKTESPYQGDWAALDHVEVGDALTGTIVLKHPFAPLFSTTLPWNAGNILCKKAVESVGGDINTSSPASSGPYAFQEWTPKQRVVLVRNPDYFGGAAAFDEVHLLPISDDKTAEAAFLAGEIDYTDISATSVPTFRENLPSDAELHVRPTETYYWIGMNTAHPLFQDQRIRQAVQYAVDVEEIIGGAFFGVTPRATGIVAPGLIGYRERNLIERPDLEKARAVMAEAGVAGGFKCTLSVLNQTDRVTACQILQAQLGRVGIEVEILPYDSGTYWSLGLEKDGDYWKDLQLMFLRYTSAPDPSWATVWFTCEQVGIYNWERWCSEEYTQLHHKALQESDPEKRHPIYVRMQDLMEESGAYVFVTHDAGASLSRTSIVPANMPNNRAIVGEFRPA